MKINISASTNIIFVYRQIHNHNTNIFLITPRISNRLFVQILLYIFCCTRLTLLNCINGIWIKYIFTCRIMYNYNINLTFNKLLQLLLNSEDLKLYRLIIGIIHIWDIFLKYKRTKFFVWKVLGSPYFLLITYL